MIQLSPREKRSEDIKKLIVKIIGENWCGEIAPFCSGDSV